LTAYNNAVGVKKKKEKRLYLLCRRGQKQAGWWVTSQISIFGCGMWIWDVGLSSDPITIFNSFNQSKVLLTTIQGILFKETLVFTPSNILCG
jgi:hypothetical protein